MDRTKPTARTPCCIRHKRDQTTSRSRAVRLAEKSLGQTFWERDFSTKRLWGAGTALHPRDNDSERVTELDSCKDTRVVRQWSERQGRELLVAYSAWTMLNSAAGPNRTTMHNTRGHFCFYGRDIGQDAGAAHRLRTPPAWPHESLLTHGLLTLRLSWKNPIRLAGHSFNR